MSYAALLQVGANVNVVMVFTSRKHRFLSSSSSRERSFITNVTHERNLYPDSVFFVTPNKPTILFIDILHAFGAAKRALSV